MEKEKKTEENEEIKEVVKEVVKEERKTHMWLITVLVICLMVVCGAFGWLAGASFFAFNEKVADATEEKEDKKTPEPAKEKHLSEGEVGDYLKIAEGFTSNFGKEYSLKVSALSNQDILDFSWRNIYEVAGKSLENGFTKEDLGAAVEKYFGKDFSYQIESIQCFAGDGTLFEFNEANGRFSRVGTHGHGGGTAIRARIYYNDAVELGDTLTLNTKVLYGGDCGDTCGPITDYYAKYPFTDSLFQVREECYFQNEGCDDYDTAFQQVKDQLPITSFVFKKQSDGKFGLSEVVVE